ncbi:MAG: heme-binding domain-containing protein [Alistipes sp.]|nr:heme-binding domain-containing protein [Alistipes sp.]
MRKSNLFMTLVLVVAVAAAAAYGILNRPPAENLPANDRVLQILEKGGCVSCHSANPKLPFYANFPGAKGLITKDVEEGYRAYDIEPLIAALRSGQMPRPVDVAKVEKVMLDQRMPQAKYYLVHWGSTTTRAKRDIILNWALNYRQLFYNDGLTGARAGEPVRPIAESVSVDPSKVELGFALYHDTRLSVDNTVSCATCHALNTAGVDNKQYSEGVDGQKGGVNAPTSYNAVYNFVQFWDGRAATLADQAAGPPLNPVEMASTSFDEIIAKLEADKQFKAAFEQVYPDGLTQANITDAIEQFERTLLTPNSAFDKYLRGDDSAITAEELRGYELFKQYDCATCHVGANLGGESYELMGLRNHYFAERDMPLTEEDNGRFKVTQQERDRHRFKVPGLRNIELTWPYYHDGSRPTLEQAVRDMGKYQSGVELTSTEVDEITAFLKTLTGEYQGKKLTNDNNQ